MIRALCILLCIITLGSCSRMHMPPQRSDLQPLTPATLSQLDGTYYNTPDSGSYGYNTTLWRQLKLRKYKGKPTSLLTVQLQATGPRTIHARLMDGNTQVGHKKLHGRYRDGYFRLRSKSAFYGMVFIYWVSLDLDTRLGTNGRGQLYADSDFAHGGGFFLFSAGTTDHWDCVYNKRQ